MIGWCALVAVSASFAVDVGATFDTPVLRPGVAAVLEVGGVSDDGTPIVQAPAVSFVGASGRLLEDAGPDARWRYLVVPAISATKVEALIEMAGRRIRLESVVAAPATSALRAPERVEAATPSGPVKIRVLGDGLPPPASVQVAVSEGEVGQVTVDGDALIVTVQPEPSMTPRHMLVLIRDGRSDDAPVLVDVRLRARPRLPLEAASGAVARVRVGERDYGPFVADANGKLDVRLEQYPGEATAMVSLEDRIGNRSQSALPLAVGSADATVILASRPAGMPGAPPALWIANRGADGRVSSAALACRTPSVGAMPALKRTGGLWFVPLSSNQREGARERRVQCAFGDGPVQVTRVALLDGYADRLRLQVWPIEVSSELPVAEVRVALEDLRGDRLPVGGVRARASFGDVVMGEVDSDTFLAEYLGHAAIERGGDVIEAVYDRPRGKGDPHELKLGWSAPLGARSRWQVGVRALDATGRPLDGVPVEVDVLGKTFRATTTATGWGVVGVPLEPGTAPLVVEGRVGVLTRRGLAVRGAGPVIGPGAPDLVVSQLVRIAVGRVAGISVDVQPPILRTGRGSVAYVSVRLEDRTGGLIADQPVSMSVSEGKIGPMVQRADGTWMAEYSPADGDRARTVTLTANAGELRTSAKIELEPRLWRLAVGPSFGGSTNFARVSALTIGIDADIRTRFLGDGLVLRVSGGGYGHSTVAETGLGSPARLTGNAFPITIGALLRRDRGGWGVWGGLGAVGAVHRTTVTIDEQPAIAAARVVPGGAMMTGAGYRLGFGEVVAEARYLWLPAGGGAYGFSGNIGGLGANLGYRLVY